MACNIGYLKLVETTPYRTWALFDAYGRILDRDNCVSCTITAGKYNMRIVTVH